MDITINVHCLVRKSDKEEYQKKKVVIGFHDADPLFPPESYLLLAKRDAIDMLNFMGYFDFEIERVAQE